MEITFLRKSFRIMSALLGLIFIINCSSDDGNGGGATASNILVTGSIVSFGSVDALSHSSSQSIQVKGGNLASNISVSVTDNFQVSLDDTGFSSQLTIDKDAANAGNQTLYVRFSPQATALGSVSGQLSIESGAATAQTVNLEGIALSIAPIVTVNSTAITFDNTQVAQYSDASEIIMAADNMESSISVTASSGFEVSLDGMAFATSIEIPMESANGENSIFVRFAPTELGVVSGTVTISNPAVSDVEVALSGNGTPVVFSYVTFDSEPLAFGAGFSQAAEQTFTLHSDVSNISQIKMYLQIDCPATGCDDWDRFANIMVRDADSGDWYEIGRYITPYWVGTELLPRGLEFDVTDFKSLLTGDVDIRIYIENWTSKADLVSIEFDYIEGTPDYEYYAIAEVMQYNANSLAGVPYGVSNSFDLTKTISFPSNTESAHLRTVISGWGHATPNDSDGRPCAEWCYRTHDVKINGATMFQHNMGPIGCASNPINNQAPGNWQPDRAGWCPGMVVPARIDQFATTMAGNSLSFEYDYEDWVNDGGNGDAYYATSTFVVVKSNTPINKPVVNE